MSLRKAEYVCGANQRRAPMVVCLIAFAITSAKAAESPDWFGQRLIDAFAKDLLSPAYEPPVPDASPPQRRIPPAPFDSPPFPSADWQIGGTPIIGDPVSNSIDGVARLAANEVAEILTLAAKRASITRAAIRLPAGQPAQVFISVVNNPNQPGTAPIVLGTFRTRDATMFSWDVSVQKARTALFFSDANRAYSTRTVGFGRNRYRETIRTTYYPNGRMTTQVISRPRVGRGWIRG